MVGGRQVHADGMVIGYGLTMIIIYCLWPGISKPSEGTWSQIDYSESFSSSYRMLISTAIASSSVI